MNEYIYYTPVGSLPHRSYKALDVAVTYNDHGFVLNLVQLRVIWGK